jgi:MATE family multidrug resistance protein
LGQDDHKTINAVFSVGLVINLALGIVLAGAMALLMQYAEIFGQEARVTSLAQPYAMLLAATIIPNMVFVHYKQFAEGLQHALPGMWVSLAWNLLNIILNYIFIYGKFGCPAWGLWGAGLATLISRIVGAFMFVAYFELHPRFRAIQRSFKQFKFERHIVSDIFRTGLPIGVQFSLEAGCFSVGSIMMGHLGSVSLAAHQIAMNVVATTFLAASGISSAATIRVSKFWGAKNIPDLVAALRIASFMAASFMLAMSALILLLRHKIPFAFVQNPEVTALASKILILAAIFQVFDGLQVVGLSVLRGLKDVRYPTYVAMIAYWVIAIPLGGFIAFYTGLGAVGFWIGLAVGLAASAVLFFIRIHKFIRRETRAEVAISVS